MNDSLQRDFVERCIMMYSSIKNRERKISRLENLRLWERRTSTKTITTPLFNKSFWWRNV